MLIVQSQQNILPSLLLLIWSQESWVSTLILPHHCLSIRKSRVRIRIHSKFSLSGLKVRQLSQPKLKASVKSVRNDGGHSEGDWQIRGEEVRPMLLCLGLLQVHEENQDQWAVWCLGMTTKPTSWVYILLLPRDRQKQLPSYRTWVSLRENENLIEYMWYVASSSDGKVVAKQGAPCRVLRSRLPCFSHIL